MSKQDKTYMGIDQYGTTFHNLGAHPRKALVDRLGIRHVSKMYVDHKDGITHHVGYVVGSHWVRLFEVVPFDGTKGDK